MKRREFIAGIGSAVAWPVVARAQQRAAMPAIGFLGTTSAAEWEPFVAAFRRGLGDSGYLEGQNVAVEYRWAAAQFDQLPELVAELARHQVAAIVTAGSANSTRAAQASGTTIPVVFVIGTDPVKLGLVASFNRPGGNMTGVTWLAAALGAKQLELLSELLPRANLIAMLVNPNNPVTESESLEVQGASRKLRREILGLHASSEGDIDSAFATLVQQRVGALIVSSDSLFLAQRNQIVALAARHEVPTIYPVQEFASAGGLISYGTRLADAYRLAGSYAGRILKGAKPGDLPIQQATTIQLVINLKTAKALGLTFPETLLATADEVIQ